MGADLSSRRRFRGVKDNGAPVYLCVREPTTVPGRRERVSERRGVTQRVSLSIDPCPRRLTASVLWGGVRGDAGVEERAAQQHGLSYLGARRVGRRVARPHTVSQPVARIFIKSRSIQGRIHVFSPGSIIITPCSTLMRAHRPQVGAHGTSRSPRVRCGCMTRVKG
jgi:hypothetical protein